jgi:hypothetical protein
VYDIILGNLSTVLEQEDEEFIPQYIYDSWRRRKARIIN